MRANISGQKTGNKSWLTSCGITTKSRVAIRMILRFLPAIYCKVKETQAEAENGVNRGKPE